MKSKKKHRPGPRVKDSSKTFGTIEAFNTYFFPKGQARTKSAKGRDRGDEAAKHEFAKIVESLPT
jgi:hypothetical protein